MIAARLLFFTLIAGAPFGLALSASAEVNPLTGNFSLEYVDCTFSRGYAWQLSRTYSARSTYRGIFGHKWQSLIEHRLEIQPGLITLHELGGESQNSFAPTSPTVYASRAFPAQKLTLKPGEWWVRTFSPDGEVQEYYDLRGRLIRLQEKNQFIDIQYNSQGVISRISDPLGQQMIFTVNPKGLVTAIQRIDAKATTPTAECRYEYDPQGQLISARNESAKTYRYDYDSQGRHLLTRVDERYSPPLVMTYFEAKLPEGKLNLIHSQKDREGNLKTFAFTLTNENAPILKETVTTSRAGKQKIIRYENGTGHEIEAQDEEQLTPEEEKVLRTYLPALTLIYVHHQKLGKKSGGTGFFISPDGVLLTNKHVVETAIREPDHFLEITLPDARVLKEKWTGLSKANLRPRLEAHATITREVRFIACGLTYARDLCLLKLNLYPQKHFSIDQAMPKEGSALFTIGNPLLKGLLIDHGLFLDRRNHNGVSEVSISIKIRPGNSGGPIFTAGGNLLGILTAQYTSLTSTEVTEQIGISAFEVKTLMDKYIAHPRTYSLEEFRKTIPPDMVWFDKPSKGSPQPERLSDQLKK